MGQAWVVSRLSVPGVISQDIKTWKQTSQQQLSMNISSILRPLEKEGIIKTNIFMNKFCPIHISQERGKKRPFYYAFNTFLMVLTGGKMALKWTSCSTLLLVQVSINEGEGVKAQGLFIIDITIFWGYPDPPSPSSSLVTFWLPPSMCV